jgi:opacity protein-like surface antigen
MSDFSGACPCCGLKAAGNPGAQPATSVKPHFMKKLLSAFFVFTGFSAFACGGYIDLPKWSISVIAVGNYGTSIQSWKPSFMPGLQINRKIKYGMEMRFAVEHTRYYHEPEFMTGADMMMVYGPERMTTFRVGVEKSWPISRWFTPYVAIDVAMRKFSSDIHYDGGIAGLNETRMIDRMGFGVMSVIGFKTQLNSRIAFFAEYRAEFFLNKTTTDVVYHYGNVDDRPYTQNTADFRLGNIGNAGFQISF